MWSCVTDAPTKSEKVPTAHAVIQIFCHKRETETPIGRGRKLLTEARDARDGAYLPVNPLKVSKVESSVRRSSSPETGATVGSLTDPDRKPPVSEPVQDLCRPQAAALPHDQQQLLLNVR